MPQRSVPAAFWRGGTSRALLFRARDLASFTPEGRSQIILTAMGSPDPDGRQIDGLGGGISSLSKAAIISAPGEGLEQTRESGAFPGVSWADDGAKDDEIWDVVYRFVQVGIKTSDLEWGGVCGNIAAAVAHATISDGIIPKSALAARVTAELPSGDSTSLPSFVTVIIKMCAGHSGEIIRAHVRVCPRTMDVWVASAGEGVSIAGVPGEAAPVLLEFPIAANEDAGLVTGHATDTVQVGGQEIEISAFSTGVVNIFVTAASLNLPPSVFEQSPGDLDSDGDLMALLEDVRSSITQILPAFQISSQGPKVVLLGPPQHYRSTSSAEIQPPDIDFVARAVSGGVIHRTIMGTTLAALTLASATVGSIPHLLVGGKSGAEIAHVRVGHPAGVAEGEMRVGKDGGKSYVVITRSAREIMRGAVLVLGAF